ncbi:MAG: hypothetical protein JWO38_2810 [Gemmataceae bacterium]|nr:hypothetical protein [Gemmataceae bacterium]
MDDKQVLGAINSDLFGIPANRVIYLEGKSDPVLFFGLLGLPQPPSGVFVHRGTLVKGFSASDGSGNTAVRRYVEVGHTKFAGRVFGVVDGDGQELAALTPQFDAPHTGPLFAWKAYSIESLLPQLAWPTGHWGVAPNWQVELAVYAPYVAINRLHQKLARRLETLKLHKHRNPVSGQQLEKAADVEAALQADKGLLAGFDVAKEFGDEITRFQVALAKSVEEGLVLLNGKWLLRHFLVERLGRTPDHWAQEWGMHAESIGGLPAVRDFWQRITGAVP